MPHEISAEDVFRLKIQQEFSVWSGGELDSGQRQYLNDLFSATYEELHRMASSIRRSQATPVMNTGTLVHATWLKLANAGRFAPESRHHFMMIAARTMRFVMVEAIRERKALKRGGEVCAQVSFPTEDFAVSVDKDVLALNDALEALNRHDRQYAQIVDCRFFGGFEEQEIADMLGISLRTVGRQWNFAKAWLKHEMQRQT